MKRYRFEVDGKAAAVICPHEKAVSQDDIIAEAEKLAQGRPIKWVDALPVSRD